MKAQEIYNRINEKHSNIILSAELIEQFGIFSASINFESGKKLRICYEPDKNHFESTVILWLPDGNTRLMTSTIENFDEILLDSLLNPKPILLSEIIIQYRKQKNLTQSDLAAKIGVSTPRISEFENRVKFSGFEKLEEIMKVLNLTISKLPDAP